MNKIGKFRWVICGLLFSLVALIYIDRLVVSILKIPIGKELGWSDEDYGDIAAAFSFAYAFGYLFAGRAIDRLRVRRGLPMFVLIWSLAVAAHGLISLIGKDEVFRLNYPWYSFTGKGFEWMTLVLPMTAAGFVVARMVLGLAEGADFPAAIRTVAEWFPVKERALATGWFNAGTNIGAVLCPFTVPWIYAKFGWPVTFYMTGVAGFVWLAAWWFLYDEPGKHRWLSPEEREYIRSGQPQTAEKVVKVPWLSLFRYRPVWAYMLASILAAPAWGFYQLFLPDFLEKRFHMGLQAVSYWTGGFFALTAIGGIGGGWLAGKLLARGWSINAARKTSLLICALAVVPVFTAPFVGSVLLTVLIVAMAGAAHQGWSANLYSVVSDTMPKEAISSVIGLGGFVCYFTGGFVSALTGVILQRTGTYVSVFAYFSGMYVVSLIAIHLLVPNIKPARIE
ncbi:MAG TPA: MFS transporter [Verrucomicrobiae bacterium]|jgi:ACS family hexuronate transporter-like MFS transporter